MIVMPKTREERISSEQKQIMVNFMEEHLDFSQGRFLGTEGTKTSLAMWEVLATQLNSVGGPKKPTKKWQRVWTDLKNKIKTKASIYNQQQEARARGDRIGHPVILANIDERVLALIPRNATQTETEDVCTLMTVDTVYNEKNANTVDSDAVAVAGPSTVSPTSLDHDYIPVLTYLSQSSPDLESEQEEVRPIPIKGVKRKRTNIIRIEEEPETTKPNIVERTDIKQQITLIVSKMNERLENIGAKQEEANTTNKSILKELKSMNSFMERIALSLESMNNKFDK